MKKEKCTKFESLNIFRNDSELQEHIKNCPDCRAEQEKMDKISELIQEVKPYYIQKRRNSFNGLKVACLMFLGLFVGVLLGYFAQNALLTTIVSSNTSTTTQTTDEYGIPVDSYGLITVN